MTALIEWDSLSPKERGAVKALSEYSFLDFQRIFFQIIQGEKWSVNWHHRYMSRPIEEIILGFRGNTLFNVPPGAGKTETLSIHAPVWSVLQTEKLRNLNISFSDSLAKRNSRRCREIVTNPAFQSLWPYSLGVNQAEEWQLINPDGRVCADIVSRPIQGQIMGGRGGYTGDEFTGWVALDDIDKPLDMFSQVKRERNHETLVNTIRSRRGNKSKWNPTPIVSIQQRLHVEDSTWFMLSGGMGLKFELIKVPALINEDYIDQLPAWIKDECWRCIRDSEKVNGYWSYWPDNEDINDLLALWDNNPYTFMSQFMQEPIKLGGDIFNPEWFLFWGEVEGSEPRPPLFEYRFITGDTANKTKSWNDFSVFCEWGVYKKRLYLLNLIRGKWEAPTLRRNFLRFLQQAWKRNCRANGNLRGAYIEDKASGTGLIQEVSARAPCRIYPVQRNIDKLTRGMDAAPQVEMGKVILPDDAPFVTEFLSEIGAFTGEDGNTDDQVDNLMDAVDIAILQGGRPNRAAGYYGSRK